MINFEKFKPEEPVFVQNVDISDKPRQFIEETLNRYNELFSYTNMQIVLVPTNHTSFECVYSGKYGSLSKLAPILKDIIDLERTSDSDITILESIIKFHERNNRIDEILQ